MYPPQPPQQPYPQPDPNQQGYAQPPYGAPQQGGEAYGLPPNPYAPPSTPMQPNPYAPPPNPYAPQQPPNPYAPPSMPLQQPNPYAPPSMPMQPPMYGAPAPMAAPNVINFNAFTLPQNRGNLTAAIGGVVGFLSFFVLPYYNVSIASVGSQNASGPDMTNGTYGASALLWLVPLCALAAVAVACIVTFGIRSIQGLTPRNAAYTILGSGGLATLICLYTLYAVNSKISQATGGLGLGTSGVSYGFSFGFWLTLLAMIAVGVGGYLNLRQVQGQPPMMPPYMGGGYPPQMPPMQ